ncbi:MAG: Na+/H+ antiporter subunit E [Thiohalophilus sp.]|jgi:multicomponent Na+:H+ antiporter subunit E
MSAANFRVTLLILASRLIWLLLLWWILSAGASESLWLGIPTAMILAVLSLVILPPVDFSWPAFFRFVPFFIIHSLRGGMDVGRRAFHPALPISPELIEYSTNLPNGIPRVFFSNIINLLPGTLSTGFDGDLLQIHVLDHGGRHFDEIAVIESRVARIFNVEKETAHKGHSG